MSESRNLKKEEIIEIITKQLFDYSKKNSIDEIVRKVTAIKTRPLPKHKPFEDSVLVLSDLHIGKKTETYSIKIYRERINRLYESLRSINKVGRTGYRLDNLHIFMVGDIIDGEDIYATHAHGIEIPVLDQILIADETLTEFIIKCSLLYKKVFIHCVKGNHGRKSKESHPNTNFDLILYHMLENKFVKIPKIKFSISHDFYNTAEVQGKNFLLIHGGQINMYLNIPWYGMQRATASWTGSFKEHFDYLVQGHFHITGMIPWNRKTLILNGTAVSSDDFGREVIKTSPSNTQWFFQVHRDRGITARYELDFLSQKERVHDQIKNW